MAYLLHPKVREHVHPRISANALAELLAFGIDRFERIVHDAKFHQSFIVARYQDAEREIVGYLSRIDRARSHLQAAEARLRAKVEEAVGKSDRDRASDNLAVFRDFMTFEVNARFGAFAFVRPTRQDALSIEGVAVSIDPDLIIHPIEAKDGPRVGGVIFRFSKGANPAAAKREATRDERSRKNIEMCRYTASLLAMRLEHSYDHLGTVSSDNCLAVDVRSGEIVALGGDRHSRAATIRKACRQIAASWDNIMPRPSLTL